MSSADLAIDQMPVPDTDSRPVRVSIIQHPRFIATLLGLALVGVAGFAMWWVNFRPYVVTDDARVAAPMVTVAPQGAGGKVERVLVHEGQIVKPGEPLVELDAAAERAMVAQDQALVDLADARVREAEAQVALEQHLATADTQRAHATLSSAQATHHMTVEGARSEEITEAQAEVDGAESALAQATRDRDRAEELNRQGFIPLASLETSRTAEAAARDHLDASRARLQLLEHGNRAEDISISASGVSEAQADVLEANAGVDRVTLRTQQLDEARAQATQARAALAMAQIALDRMTLRSATGGSVVRVSVDPGDSVAAGQGAITIVDVEHAWIAANVQETVAGRLKPGQPVTITIDEGGTLSGKVEVIEQSTASQFALIPSDNAAGNFTKVVQRIPIRVVLDPSERIGSLRVGESVVLRIRVQ
ncbi:MAG: HlyD family secretion protein [bacterium]